MKGAYEGNILYMVSFTPVIERLKLILSQPALYASLTIEEIAAAKPTNDTQVTFQQVYLDSNDTTSQAIFKRAQAAGSKAIILTVDSAADGNRHRAARYGVGSA